MKRDELTAQQASARQTFVTTLDNLGWSPSPWEALFQQGTNVEPEAQADWKNPTFDIRLGYFVGEGWLRWELMERDGDLALTLRLWPRDDLEPALVALTAATEMLDRQNYAAVLKGLLPFFHRVQLETEDGPVLLS